MSSETARVTSEEFRLACGRFATGVTVATVLDSAGSPHGLTVNSFTSVSLEPPLILICLGHAVATLAHFRASTHFGINVLADSQRSLSVRFARKGKDRFDGVPWCPGITGVPLLTQALAHIECEVYRRIPMGDHDIFVGEMVRVQVYEGEPLIYFASTYRKLEEL
jgi:flavin reductase (DIM6/NTAB) family NADH-FMN oxidoreductase RutF